MLSFLMRYGALIFPCFQPYLSFAFEPRQWTLRQYADVLFDNPERGRAIRKSLVLAAGGATATILLSLLIGYIVIRTRRRARFLLDYLATFQPPLPPVLYALALLSHYLFIPLPSSASY